MKSNESVEPLPGIGAHAPEGLGEGTIARLPGLGALGIHRSWGTK